MGKLDSDKQRIKDHIIDLIESRQLKQGDKIPTQIAVSSKLNTSSLTASYAYRELKEEGYIDMFDGNRARGYFVTKLVRPVEPSQSSEVFHIDEATETDVRRVYMEYKVLCEVSGIKVTVSPDKDNSLTIYA